ADPLRTIDAGEWVGESIHGLHVLCLAAGGGRQGPLYAAAGARVTVVDLSPKMLELDRQVARERGLDLETVEASMDAMPMFGEARFDFVIHPVSTCYVPRIEPVYREVARVLRPAGLYISQHKSPVSLQVPATAPENVDGYRLAEPYYRQGPLPASQPSRVRESGALEFLHRWESLLGGLCRAGFVIEDFLEPKHADVSAEEGTFGHRSCFVAPYVRIKARRRNKQFSEDGSQAPLWIPKS
ncbi:MAG: class I SAM-dependent methyltransferase, partial [Planctomycetales bacterium]|nr:class I SAM-dependent methyltransferase [Planctomycetales bacterium]